MQSLTEFNMYGGGTLKYANAKAFQSDNIEFYDTKVEVDKLYEETKELRSEIATTKCWAN